MRGIGLSDGVGKFGCSCTDGTSTDLERLLRAPSSGLRHGERHGLARVCRRASFAGPGDFLLGYVDGPLGRRCPVVDLDLGRPTAARPLGELFGGGGQYGAALGLRHTLGDQHGLNGGDDGFAAATAG